MCCRDYLSIRKNNLSRLWEEIQKGPKRGELGLRVRAKKQG